MNLSPPAQRPAAAFTMVEIALCIGIIGFALVAIIGVLPAGLKVQKDNREETIINHDAQFLLEAFRSGGTGPALDTLFTNFDEIRSFDGTNYVTNTPLPPGTTLVPGYFTTGAEIIGLNCRPFQIITNIVRPFAGELPDKGTNPRTQSSAFKYFLLVDLEPLVGTIVTNTTGPTNLVRYVTNAWELRLEFKWPFLPNGNVGRSRKVFRTLVAGDLVQSGYLLPPTNYPNVGTTWFFVPHEFLP
jgi:type II secretory pathway pseudopilin PulG